MAAIPQLARHPGTPDRQRRFIVCHCTVAHAELKSRTFHRQLLPLAQLGFDIRYAAPMQCGEPSNGIRMIGLRAEHALLRRLLAWPRLFRILLRQNAHIYHFQDPQLLPVAIALKLVCRRRIVYDAYEDFPSIAAGKKAVPALVRHMAAVLVDCTERLAARIFDAVITADPITLRRFARSGKSTKIVFYNFPNLDFFPAPRPRPAAFDVVYRGGISERTGSMVLLDALQILASRLYPPRLLMIGYFDSLQDERAFCQRVRSLGIEPLVEIRGRIDHKQMAGALGEARIGVSPLLGVRKFQRNIPVKIFEYWACGMPVVATDLDPTRPFFRDGDAGLLVRPGNAVDLARAVAWLLNHPEAAIRMGERGRQLVAERFNNASEVHKLRRLIVSVAGQPRKGGMRPCSNLS